MPEPHPALLEKIPKIEEKYTSERTMKILGTLIKINLEKKIQKRNCFFDIKLIQDVEKLKKELRNLILKKLRALKKSDKGEEEDPYTLKQRLNLLKLEKDLGNMTSKRDNDSKE